MEIPISSINLMPFEHKVLNTKAINNQEKNNTFIFIKGDYSAYLAVHKETSSHC
jgi:hypothetical protein